MTRTTATVGTLVVAGVVTGCLAWPRIHQVETGRTPEYPDVKPRSYAAGEEKVAAAVTTVIGRLPLWRVVGAARGAKGMDVQAEHAVPLVGLKEDITVRVRRLGGRTEVGVLSRSPSLPWDFGQNARNIRHLLDELDRQMEPPAR